MKRLLVTGVSGLLGLNLAYLSAGSYQVTGVLRGKRAVSVPGRTPFEVVAADLTQAGQIERLMEQTCPDAIIHCAALTDVDRCQVMADEAEQINALLPGQLAQAALKNGVRLLHISTDAVFDGARGDYTEEDQPRPINTYARTKLAGERAVADANPDALVARVNFFGWSWQGSRSLSEYFFHHLSAGQAVPGYTDLQFCPLLVNDMVEILLRMLEQGLSGLYHVVSSEAQSKFSFGRMLAREFGLDEALIFPASYQESEMQAPRSPRLTLRSDKLAQALGETLPGQQAGLRRYASLYRQGYPQALRAVLAEPNHSIAG